MKKVKDLLKVLCHFPEKVNKMLTSAASTSPDTVIYKCRRKSVPSIQVVRALFRAASLLDLNRRGDVLICLSSA